MQKFLTALKQRFWFLPLLFITLYVIILFRPLFLEGKLPIPADTIVGLYHPWRDFVADRYPNGIPFQNSLITDAVRQQYPWRKLAIDQLKLGQLPVWNPYSFAGYPLLANIQSAPFYPLNFLYWLASFPTAWSVQVMLQTLLGGIFIALFLRNLRLQQEAVVLGSLAWMGSGFFVSWLTANVIVHTIIWLPLILLAIDKIFSGQKLIPALLLTFSLSAAFFAGHLQTDFYLLIVTGFYFLWRTLSSSNKRPAMLILVCFGAFVLVTSVQWRPFMEFLLVSGRNSDQAVWQKEDWFIPGKHLAQFLAPDYFGNPATLNYFGVWNYAEFIGYVGLIPIFFALLAIFKRAGKGFFLTLLVLGLVMALPTFLAKIPFQMGLPFFSSAQPSRLLSIIDFSAAVLAALGFDWFLTEKEKTKKQIIITIGVVLILFGCLWLAALRVHNQVSIRNLVLPTAILGSLAAFLALWFSIPKWRKLLVFGLLAVSLFDLSRFAGKFIPFTSLEWLYPSTKVTKFLTDKAGNDVFRIAFLDDRIMTPNFSVIYKLQSTAGYDPLYLSRYGEFVAALERGKANIDPPFGYSRQIQPHNYKNKLFNLLGAKYVLSLYELSFPGYTKVAQEGQTRVFENQNVLPRAFFVSAVISSRDKQQAIDNMYDPDFKPEAKAVVENYDLSISKFSTGQAVIREYHDSEIKLSTQNEAPGFLVITDIYYPTWQAFVDGVKTKIYLTDFTFRGIFVPAGSHQVRFFL